MGVFQRMKSIFAGAVHDALDKMEDPVVSARQTVRELDKSIKEAESAFFDLSGNLQLLAKKLLEKKQLLQKRNDQLAALAGMEADEAELVLELKETLRELEIEVDSLLQQEAELRAVKNDVESQIEQNKSLRDKVSRRLSKMETEMASATAMTRAAEIKAGLGTDRLDSNFARLESKVEAKYAAAQARFQHTQNSKEANLDERVAKAARGK